MKIVRAFLAATGALTATAEGQTAWTIEVTNVVSRRQPSTTVRFLAGVDLGRDFAFAAARFDVRASEGEWRDPTVLLPPPFDPGTIVGPNITGIALGQIYFPGVPPPWINPLPVYEVTWETSTFSPLRDVEITTHTQRYDVYISQTSPASQSRLFELVEGRAYISVVPAPTSLAIMGLIMMFTAGRRRNRNP